MLESGFASATPVFLIAVVVIMNILEMATCALENLHTMLISWQNLYFYMAESRGVPPMPLIVIYRHLRCPNNAWRVSEPWFLQARANALI